MPLKKEELSKVVWDQAPANPKDIDTSKVVWDKEPAKVAGLYSKNDLASKVIPQFTKGLYDSDLGELARPVLDILPNAEKIKEIQAGTPDPKGILPTAGRMAGEIAPYMAMSAPFTNFAGIIPKASKLVKLATGMGAYEGAKDIVQGKFKEAPGDAALGFASTYFGGKGIELAGKGIQGAAKAFEKSPGVIINSLIKPLLKDFSYGKNPGRAVAAEGITANGFDELAGKISQRLSAIGGEIGRRLTTHSNKRIDLRGFLRPLDSAIMQALKSPRTNSALLQRLVDLKDDLMGVVQQNGATLTRNIIDLTPQEATAIKMEIGNLTKWTGNASDDKLVNKALKRAYGIVKGKINRVVPELSKLNERYADLLSAKIATEYRDKITARQNLVKLSGRILGGGMVLNGLSRGDWKMVALGLSEPAVEAALSSPVLKTRLAAVLAKVPPADLQKIVQKYPALKELPGVAGRLTAFGAEKAKANA